LAPLGGIEIEIGIAVGIGGWVGVSASISNFWPDMRFLLNGYRGTDTAWLFYGRSRPCHGGDAQGCLAACQPAGYNQIPSPGR